MYKKIVFTGPECSGKTTWSKWCADTFGGTWIPEYARTYLDGKSNYNIEDLLNIAKQQHQLIVEANNPPIWCDTDLLTIKIWSEVKYNTCHNWIKKSWLDNLPNLYVLCAPDIPWEADPLREAEHSRKQLFDIYLKQVLKTNIDFIVLEGTLNEKKSILSSIFL